MQTTQHTTSIETQFSTLLTSAPDFPNLETASMELAVMKEMTETAKKILAIQKRKH